MASNRRRQLRQDIPPSDDPSDDDFNIKASHTSPNKRKARTQGRLTGNLAKRQRRTHTYDSDEIEDDTAEEEDNPSAQESDEDEVPARINERTGRPARRSTQGPNYQELSDADIEIPCEDSDHAIGTSSKGRVHAKAPNPSLVVILRVPSGAFAQDRSTRARTASKGVIKPPERITTRRSSRISRENSIPLLALTDSGKHTKITRTSASRSPPPFERRTRGGKGLRKPSTSDIVEASQEDSGRSAQNLLKSDVFEEFPEVLESMPIVTSNGVALDMGEDMHIAESVQANDDDEEEGVEDQMPVTRSRRVMRSSKPGPVTTSARSPRRSRRQAEDESSEYDAAVEEPEEEEEMSASDGSASPQKVTQQSDVSSTGRRSGRLAKKSKATRRSRAAPLDSEDLDPEELAEEAADLKASRAKKRRTSAILYDEPNLRRRNNKVDYRLFKPENAAHFAEDDDPPEQTTGAMRKKRGGGNWRSLYSTYGPFGGGGLAPVFPGPEGAVVIGGPGAAGDSDSSDDELGQLAVRPVGAAVGITPTSALPMSLFAQTVNVDTSLALPNHGKSKDKKALADADPLGVDEKVNFEGVGGLDGHINQLKEMVILPLLYPEVFQRFNVTPPRGVLFHGPPGTGKTLLARALASSVSAGGQKINFYMRKGADTLSKYVGEAERQLRVLFEEARKCQPSIIFFDEIDGLAPVRSSKQEQVHASIVATLLALMDGMDGRGQVIIIGATNRPDAVDAALRRPGRFDREFYFPLPDQSARRSILDIHTTGWEPPLDTRVKDQLAALTKGYGGADLRALCTEAALNAVQGTFPQIYSSNEKLVIDPTQIRVLAKDFMISLNRMIPSSERSGSSGSSPLESRVEPLLRESLKSISKILDEILPPKKTATALEEAQFDDRDEGAGFDKEMMRQAFDRARVYRPRLLIHGPRGMGQQYIGAAVLNKFERLFVQPVGLSILYGDSARTPEAAIIQLFNEAKRHKPSVIYIPNITTWYSTVGPSVIQLFRGLLRSLAPNDQVLVLGVMEWEDDAHGPDQQLIQDLFDGSSKSQFELPRITDAQRGEYFEKLIDLIRKPPSEYPDLDNRKKRVWPSLAKAVSKILEGPTEQQRKAQLKGQKKADRHALNMLKMCIQPIMDLIKKTYKRFRVPPIDDAQIAYLFTEADSKNLVSDLPEEQRAQEQYRPYEIKKDEKGEPGLLDVTTGKFYYNMEIVTIEQRLSNGYYKRTKDFLADIKKLAKDAKTSGEVDRVLKANELQTNVEVDLKMIEVKESQLMEACEQVYLREVERAEQRLKQVQSAPINKGTVLQILAAIPANSYSTEQSTGPVVLGERVPGRPSLPVPKDLISDREYSSLSLSNGDHVPNSQSNGSFEAVEEDVQMSNSQDASTHQQESNHTDAHYTPLNRMLSATQSLQRPVRSSITPMVHGSQVADYHNSASTTTSGQKTSNQSSGQKVNTQSTNGMGRSEHPDFSEVGLGRASHLPDTQDPNFPSSGSQAHASQTSPGPSQCQPSMAPPALRNGHSSINALLNDPEPSPPHPTLIVDEEQLRDLQTRLTFGTQDCSVEELEQINASLMYTIWQNRSDWDRERVATAVLTVFDETRKAMSSELEHHNLSGIREHSQYLS